MLTDVNKIIRKLEVNFDKYTDSNFEYTLELFEGHVKKLYKAVVHYVTTEFQSAAEEKAA